VGCERDRDGFYLARGPFLSFHPFSHSFIHSCSTPNGPPVSDLEPSSMKKRKDKTRQDKKRKREREKKRKEKKIKEKKRKEKEKEERDEEKERATRRRR